MRKKKNKLITFVPVRRDLLKDKKWRKLSFSAMVLYVYLKAELNGKNCQDEVAITYVQMEDIMSTKTLSKAYKELIKATLIKKTKIGGLYGGVTKYRFTGDYKDRFRP